MAGEWGGDKARILVLTDHAPVTDPGEGRVQWWSFGEPRGNSAFVNALRTTRAGHDRLLFEIANISNEARANVFVLEAHGKTLYRENLALGAKETRRLLLKIPDSPTVVRARIDDDALALDNHVDLVREETPSVRVEVRVRAR